MEAGPRCEFVFKGIKTGCHAKCVLGERQFRIISQNIFIEKKINFVFCVKGEVVKKRQRETGQKIQEISKSFGVFCRSECVLSS